MKAPGPSPRRTAVEILTRIDTDGAYAEPLLDSALSRATRANPQDRALLTELVYGTLRQRGRLDWIVAQLYRGDPATLAPPVANLLRTGLYQLWFTDRIPPFAAVNETVTAARTLAPQAAGLVNALLRSALRRKDRLPWPEVGDDPAVAMAVLESHPVWLVRRWLAQYGQEETTALCRANNRVPPVALRVNRLKASPAEVIAALDREGIAAEPALFSGEGLLLRSSAATLRQTRAFREGWFRVQDEASQLVSLLMAPRPGERVLDLCAGTGGKTLHLAALMENRGTIVALDRRPEGLRRLQEESRRLGVTVATTDTRDAATLPEAFRDAFDRVLLDAPCSGLGTLRRNPEIRWRLAPREIQARMRIQRQLLEAAAACVRPGGRLVYSVCAVTPEENELVVRDLLRRRSDIVLASPPAGERASGCFDDDGFFRSYPHRHGMDGFFAALLDRTA